MFWNANSRPCLRFSDLPVALDSGRSHFNQFIDFLGIFLDTGIKALLMIFFIVALRSRKRDGLLRTGLIANDNNRMIFKVPFLIDAFLDDLRFAQ